MTLCRSSLRPYSADLPRVFSDSSFRWRTNSGLPIDASDSRVHLRTVTPSFEISSCSGQNNTKSAVRGDETGMKSQWIYLEGAYKCKPNGKCSFLPVGLAFGNGGLGTPLGNVAFYLWDWHSEMMDWAHL